MSFDIRAFRSALGCFPTGVAVITATTDTHPMGITVNSFTSVSLDPPLILWCLDKRSDRYQVFTKAKGRVMQLILDPSWFRWNHLSQVRRVCLQEFRARRTGEPASTSP